MRKFKIIAGVITVLASTSAHAATLAAVGNAYVTRDERADTWTLSNDDITLVLGFGDDTSLQIRALRPGSTTRSLIQPGPETFVKVSAKLRALTRSGDVSFQTASAEAVDNGVELRLVFELKDPHLTITRHYRCYARAAVVEIWTSLASSDATLAIDDLNAWTVTTRRGEITWLTGLQASNGQQPFTLQHRALEADARLELGARGRSSESAVPWFVLDAGDGQLFGGMMWSGAWQGAFQATTSRIQITMGLPSTSTSLHPGDVLEMPHGFIGGSGAGTGLADVSAALRLFIADGLRHGRGFPDLVTYNTWFPYGSDITEADVRDELATAVSLGVEAFVLDAGWYPNTGVDGPADFTSGLGAWEADGRRFPSGLETLGDDMRALGLRFGIWVEPERVSLDLVGTDDGPAEQWLAQHDGRYDADNPQPEAGQICLGSSAARAWLLDRLEHFIDATHPDYLKWDNNFWINCNREGHGHGAADGNFHHVRGLYEMLSALRERYPDLLIENVSGGGNRLDLGMMEYSDVAWMDDHSAPSSLVRHNLEGLSTVFPPAYLFSFLMAGEGEPLHAAPDLPLYVRSRMPGVLGLSYRSVDLETDDRSTLAEEIGSYKTLRDTIADSSAVILTGQVNPDDESAWDALEEIEADTGGVLIFAFEGDEAADRVVLKPGKLDASTTYEITSLGLGTIGRDTGASLMRSGIELRSSAASAAHILILTPVSE